VAAVLLRRGEGEEKKEGREKRHRCPRKYRLLGLSSLSGPAGHRRSKGEGEERKGDGGALGADRLGVFTAWVSVLHPPSSLALPPAPANREKKKRRGGKEETTPNINTTRDDQRHAPKKENEKKGGKKKKRLLLGDAKPNLLCRRPSLLQAPDDIREKGEGEGEKKEKKGSPIPSLE